MSLRDDLTKFKIGMSRKLVTLIPHQSDWPSAFDTAKKYLRQATSNRLELHHIGSTSIPGIHAKPILDILGVTSSIQQFDELQDKIESLGFVWKGEYGIPNRRYCVLYDRAEEVGLIHLHVFAESDDEVEKHLIFRDYLLSSPQAAQRYEALKLELAHSCAKTRSNYSEGKSTLISELLNEAYSWKNTNE